jgi:hypothetical protein
MHEYLPILEKHHPFPRNMSEKRNILWNLIVEITSSELRK